RRADEKGDRREHEHVAVGDECCPAPSGLESRAKEVFGGWELPQLRQLRDGNVGGNEPEDVGRVGGDQDRDGDSRRSAEPARVAMLDQIHRPNTFPSARSPAKSMSASTRRRMTMARTTCSRRPPSFAPSI